MLKVERCERVQLVASAVRLSIASCHDCVFYLGVNRPPLLLGDNRFLQVLPTPYQWSLPSHSFLHLSHSTPDKRLLILIISRFALGEQGTPVLCLPSIFSSSRSCACTAVSGSRDIHGSTHSRSFKYADILLRAGHRWRRTTRSTSGCRCTWPRRE